MFADVSSNMGNLARHKDRVSWIQNELLITDLDARLSFERIQPLICAGWKCQ